MIHQEHHNFQCLDRCPICTKCYDKHWKVVNHVRKYKDEKHQDFLSQQECQVIDIYLSSTMSNLHESLFKVNNIFCGISYAKISNILHQRFSPEELENIRIKHISQTMAKYPKTAQHNANVAQGMIRAWSDGKFDTDEVKRARRQGYARRRSFAGSANPMYGKPCPKNAGRGKGGFRLDLGHYVRSRWEANICRVLISMGRQYDYEKTRFPFTLDGHDCTYCPDLYLRKTGKYYEIKGHARSSSEWHCECRNCIKTKAGVKHLRQLGIKIMVIGKNEYLRFMRMFQHKISWEK